MKLQRIIWLIVPLADRGPQGRREAEISFFIISFFFYFKTSSCIFAPFQTMKFDFDTQTIFALCKSLSRAVSRKNSFSDKIAARDRTWKRIFYYLGRKISGNYIFSNFSRWTVRRIFFRETTGQHDQKTLQLVSQFPNYRHNFQPRTFKIWLSKR